MAAAAPSSSQRSPDKLHPGCIVTETVSAFSALLCFAISLQMDFPTGKYPVLYRETPPAPFCRLRQSPASLSIKTFFYSPFPAVRIFSCSFPVSVRYKTLSSKGYITSHITFLLYFIFHSPPALPSHISAGNLRYGAVPARTGNRKIHTRNIPSSEALSFRYTAPSRSQYAVHHLFFISGHFNRSSRSRFKNPFGCCSSTGRTPINAAVL